MGHSQDDSVLLIAVELGAVWPDFLADLQRTTPNCVLEVQSKREPYSLFVERIGRRLRDMDRDRQQLAGAALVTHLVPEPNSAREPLCQSLLTKISRGGDLTLAAEAAAESRTLGHQLFELTGALCEKDDGRSGVSVRVRFYEAAHRSGSVRKHHPVEVLSSEAAS